jgi:hypothetical protein
MNTVPRQWKLLPYFNRSCTKIVETITFHIVQFHRSMLIITPSGGDSHHYLVNLHDRPSFRFIFNSIFS